MNRMDLLHRKPTPGEALELAVESAGGVREFSRRLGVSRQSVYNWLNSGSGLPARWVRAGSKVSGVRREWLRPELYE